MKKEENTRKKCLTCTNYDKEAKNCKNESHNCSNFDFSKCNDYLISEKLVMF